MPGINVQQGGGTLQPGTLAAIQLMAAAFVPTQGNIFFVNPFSGNDTNPGSITAPLKTLAQALALATAGQNDIVYMLANSNTASQTTDYQTANLNWNKDMVHLIGVNGGPMIGQRSRVAALSTVTAFANLFTLSANGCLIANIEFFQGQMGTNPTAASTCVTVSGVRNRFQNCQISGIGHSDLDDAGSNSLTITGDENIFQHCYIGLDTVIRATATAECILSGAPARTIFEDCVFASYTSGSTFKAVSIATTVDRFVQFKDCVFYTSENITSAVAPTGAIGITTMNGQVQVIRPSVFGYSLLSTGGNAYVKVLAFQNATTVQGIGASAAAS
jgi:hypothetical protein